MEFWGVEVKPNETLKCEPGDDKYLHLSQVANMSLMRILFLFSVLMVSNDFNYSNLGNSKKDELGKPATAKVATAKAATSVAKLKTKTEEPNKADKLKAKAFVDEDDFGDEDDDEEDVDEDDSDDEDMLDMAGDSDDEDDEDNSDEEDEETPNKVESGKKRLPESASKTPAPAKKAKLVSPAGGQKTGGDGKKGGHTATPHPAKQVGKTPASGDKSKQQTPKSAGSVACKSCSKTFNSENALQAHTKAKHAAAK
ncbi:hypothetical protein J5N97_018275 [Dioscorea zingiberensis]|uniref:C2H2-type domain-containing protein n=1 Tax=Dioscorea zingiberensis TaxID=325984 RepID=A0A9D5CMZ9_9LILI|nr:hypothetical protein J5N97_018275 [Dioscorea zingiberensis]